MSGEADREMASKKRLFGDEFESVSEMRVS